MQYINKESDREAGNKITEAYLHEIWIEDEQRYPVDYNDSFKKLPNKANSYYKQMTQVLLNNQNHYCCYCMRRLTGKEIPPLSISYLRQLMIRMLSIIREMSFLC